MQRAAGNDLAVLNPRFSEAFRIWTTGFTVVVDKHDKHLPCTAALWVGTSGDGCRMGLWGTVSSSVLVAKYSCTACSRSKPVACEERIDKAY